MMNQPVVFKMSELKEAPLKIDQIIKPRVASARKLTEDELIKLKINLLLKNFRL